MNLHGVSPTAPSTLRVYQFRHSRMYPQISVGSHLVAGRPTPEGRKACERADCQATDVARPASTPEEWLLARSGRLRQQVFDQFCPIAGTDGQRLIVKVIARIVQKAATLAMAIAHPDVTTGILFQHKGEIL